MMTVKVGLESSSATQPISVLLGPDPKDEKVASIGRPEGRH